jgi:hypothetical protein
MHRYNSRFLHGGGWGLINQWLNDCQAIQQWPLLLQILDLLDNVEVTNPLLKENNTPKIIKALARECPHPGKSYWKRSDLE